MTRTSNIISAAHPEASSRNLNKAMTYLQVSKYTWDGLNQVEGKQKGRRDAMEIQHVIKMLMETGYIDDDTLGSGHAQLGPSS